MANDVTTTVWRIDTLPFTFTGRLYIASAEWSDQVAAGDALVATQSNGKPLWDTKASSANFLQDLGKQGWVNGITVTTLTSGVLTMNVGGCK